MLYRTRCCIELQAAYCCFITGYYTQTYLPNINEELRRLDDAINNKLIPSFTGKLCGNDERLLLSLPTKSALRLSVRIRSYSGPHFPHSNWTRTRITPNWDTFYAVPVECEYLFFCEITEIEFQNSLLSTLTKKHV